MCFDRLIFWFKALFVKWMSVSVKQFLQMFSHEYLGHVLILCLSWQGTSTWDGDSHSSALPRLERYVFPACWRTAMFSAEMQCPLWPLFHCSHLQALFILTLIFTLVPSLFLFFLPPADDFSSQDNIDVPEAGGWDAMLSSEDEDEFFDLQIVKHYDGEVRMWPHAPSGLSQAP